jgi:hypothetical protein
VIVGPERHDGEGNYLGTADTTFTVDQVSAMVTFLDPAEVAYWAGGTPMERQDQIEAKRAKPRANV